MILADGPTKLLTSSLWAQAEHQLDDHNDYDDYILITLLKKHYSSIYYSKWRFWVELS